MCFDSHGLERRNCFTPIDDYFYPRGYETMNQRDAEIAVAIQLFNENPGITNEQAIKLGEEFIRQARVVHVLLEKGERKGSYWGKDPYKVFICCGF